MNNKYVKKYVNIDRYQYDPELYMYKHNNYKMY